MYAKINLIGTWKFQLDEAKQGLQLPITDTIELPGTTSYCKKGKKNENVEIGCLTDEYKFDGYAWFTKTITISDEISSKNCFLYLERTRMTSLWINGVLVGNRNSLCTPHNYDITSYICSGENTITILVDNTNYPTKGGHLTSPDTQTNWNGITGQIELRVFDKAYLEDVQVYPNIQEKSVSIKARVIGLAVAVYRFRQSV